mmetsp:Transcript_46725/g.74799  ORF Transcript_46725/g.74799 Transcript_46725/m.74799 type:complete len:372 (-) Transcript_46725:35-1150(-)
MTASLLFAASVSLSNAFTIFQPLPWEQSWKELIIEEFDAVDHKQAFEGWKRTFNKAYDIEQEADRFLVWLDNWYSINKHNQDEAAPFKLRMNEFSDLSRDEFRRYIHGSTDSCFHSMARSGNTAVSANKVSNSTTPKAWDWTDVDGVSWVAPVKNQGNCGGCWAFSAVGAIESAAVIANYYNDGKPPPVPIPTLSEQQLIDCSKAEGNMGCSGGLMDDAFTYVVKTGGLCSEAEYAYTAQDGSCKASSCGTYYDPITSYTDVDTNDEAALMSAVAQHPVSIAIEADQYAFQFYHSGVLSGRCGDKIDHGVLLVGYGHDDDAKLDYWKIKNSWGESWGQSGYIKICRNCDKNKDNGECGILMAPSFPVAKKQ